MSFDAITNLFNPSQHQNWSSFFIQLLANLLSGLILGIVLERKFSVSKFISKVVQKPTGGSSAQEVSGDLEQKAEGQGIIFNNSPGASVSVGNSVSNKFEATGQPKLLNQTLPPNKLFIYTEIKDRFGQISAENDYSLAENYRLQDDGLRPAATLYCRFFSPVIEKLNEPHSSALEREVNVLKHYSSVDGRDRNLVDNSVASIERILYQVFQKP